MTDADRLPWTDAAPTEPGFYWLRAPGQRLVVTEVENGRAAFGSGLMPVGWIRGARWAGPLHPPADVAVADELLPVPAKNR